MITSNGWVGVDEIIDPADLRNARGDKVAADATFYDIIEWLKDEVPKIERHSFFTNVDVGYVGETMVVFHGRHYSGSVLSIMLDAAALRHEAADPQGRVIYEGSATARCALELAFTGEFSPRKLYPGYEARHGAKPHPIGRIRPDWGSGPMYEFADGANPADYTEGEAYRFFVDGEWLMFRRTSRVVYLSGPATSPFSRPMQRVPAWRLEGR